MTNEQKMMVLSLRKQGLGYKRISDRTGVSLNTIKSFCRRASKTKDELDHGEQSICQNCGIPIEQTPGRKRKKFCSDRCRNVWWNAHLELVERRAIYEITCAHCGKRFSVYGDANRKYCSHECYIADRFGDPNSETKNSLSSVEQVITT